MITLLAILHVIVCFFLIGVVLLQSGKAADLAGAFGGMGSQTAFGPRGTATLLSRWTTIAAAAFMLTSMALAVLGSRGKGIQSSVVDRVKPQTAQPATPGQPGSIGVTTTGAGGAPSTQSVPLPMPQQGGGGAATPAGQAPVTPAPAPAPDKK